MRFTTQRRNAAQLLKCALRKVRFDPEHLQEIKEAITKTDIRSLIDQGFVAKQRSNAQSRVRARMISKQKRKGLRRGHGSRKGKKNARLRRKEIWKNRVRVQRGFMKKLKTQGMVDNASYRETYAKIKGGFFRSKRHVKLYLEERKLITPR